jgi:hypothetical protein
MLYRGSCHCGSIAFEVEGKIEAAVVCNCSICSRKGALLWAVPRADLRLLTSDEGVGRYTFNNHVIEHRFCRTCGIHPYAEDVATDGERSAYVNIRCLEGVDLAAIPTIEFDGRSM